MDIFVKFLFCGRERESVINNDNKSKSNYCNRYKAEQQ